MDASLSTLLGLRTPGRARACVALLVGAVLACWACCPPGRAACGCVFLPALIVASFIDLDQMVIPDLFTIGLAFTGLALSAAVPSLHEPGAFSVFASVRSAAAAALGLAIGSSLLLWFGLAGEFILGREVIGFGDVKLLGAIGAFCGWQGAVCSVFGGAALGAIALALAALHGRIAGGRPAPWLRLESPDGAAARVGWGVHFPFGPMLAAAAGLYFLALHPWVDRGLARYLALF
jgi:leader peptidase (prepilin peptidase)/N-methyltransferase